MSGAKRDFPSIDIFDSLFDKWANEAVQVVKFLANKPEQGNRIPDIVKRKVAQLCEMKICIPDSKPACFRIIDSKKGGGGPYNRFSYYNSIKRIVPNWEYFVQIAAFRDLIVEHGYSPDWMKFEYKEFGPVSISVDIGIKLPTGPKIFVEVKETRAQWEMLISGINTIGMKGVDLNGSDRGNDPLRKAKYIVGGRPDFFVGYSPEGLTVYKVKYGSDSRFILQIAVLPAR